MFLYDSGKELVVMDDKFTHYRLKKDDLCPDQWGRYDTMTYGEAYRLRVLFIHDDTKSGESYGMHGAAYYSRLTPPASGDSGGYQIV